MNKEIVVHHKKKKVCACICLQATSIIQSLQRTLCQNIGLHKLPRAFRMLFFPAPLID